MSFIHGIMHRIGSRQLVLQSPNFRRRARCRHGTLLLGGNDGVNSHRGTAVEVANADRRPDRVRFLEVLLICLVHLLIGVHVREVERQLKYVLDGSPLLSKDGFEGRASGRRNTSRLSWYSAIVKSRCELSRLKANPQY